MEAMSVNSLPWIRVLVAPYITPSPAPPSPVNRLPVSVMFLEAVIETLARGWVSDPQGQLPAGLEKLHMPWLFAAVIRRLLCTSENPAPVEGAFQVACENWRPLKVMSWMGVARVPAPRTSVSRRGSSTVREDICWPAEGR